MKKASKLFQYIEQAQCGQDWGSFLDAGTGLRSIEWVQQLKTDRWTAVTGAPKDAKIVRDATEATRRSQDQIIVGNWARSDLLKGDVFDTVLADYLLGAVEGFAPYFQPYLFARLRPLTRKKLYVTGAEPYVPSDQPKTSAGVVVWEIGRFRDACLLLSGELPYREYPSAWVVDQLNRSGFRAHSVKQFDVRYQASFVNSQIDLSLAALAKLTDKAVASAMAERGNRLRDRGLDVISAEGGLAHGFDYVIVADPI